MLGSIRSLARSWDQYGNPLSMAWQRLRRRPVETRRDRDTGLVFRCRAAGACMMAESFQFRVYDVAAAPLRPGDLVFDVGANHGFFACRAAWKGARVQAFEPDPRLLPLLRENVAANGLADRITVHAGAIAGHDGEATLHLTESMGGGMNSVAPRFVRAFGGGDAGTARVPCWTLPSLLRRHADAGPARLVKLDCEGAELAALRLLEDFDLARVDAFAIEFHPEAYPLEELLGLVFSWRGFHVARLARPGAGDMLHVVSERALREDLRLAAKRFEFSPPV